MTWLGKSFIKFCKSFINSIKLVSTRTCSSARVRPYNWAALGPGVMMQAELQMILLGASPWSLPATACAAHVTHTNSKQGHVSSVIMQLHLLVQQQLPAGILYLDQGFMEYGLHIHNLGCYELY